MNVDTIPETYTHYHVSTLTGQRSCVTDLQQILAQYYNLKNDEVKVTPMFSSYKEGMNYVPLEIRLGKDCYKFSNVDDAKKMFKKHFKKVFIEQKSEKFSRNLEYGKWRLKCKDEIDSDWIRGGISIKHVKKLFAASEGQTLTKCHWKFGSNEFVDRKCRHCGQAVETVYHILNRCEKFKKSLFVSRHNNIYVKGRKIYKNNNAEIFFDTPYPLLSQVVASNPDMVIIDKQRRKSYVFDFAVSFFPNMKQMESIKKVKYTWNGTVEVNNSNYQDIHKQPKSTNYASALEEETGYECMFIPVVFSSFGDCFRGTKDLLNKEFKIGKLASNRMWAHASKEVVLGSVRIIEHHLA
uniref:Zf-RVT domain-containing protein n=1 Tax=Strongyloides papillosus TaxID=174720 RepID=A0A0N5BG94_STREA